jgi:CheY-like chemotaxis protein
MDMRMPEMDGLAATQLIRQRGGKLAHVPIVALTANAFPEDVKACFDAGMNQFVTKPVSKDVLFSAILRGLSPATALGAPPVGIPSGDGEAHGLMPFDAAALHTLGENIGHDGVAEMLEVFQQETRARLQRMMAPGIPSATLMREAHTLKGAAGTVCAPLLHRRAEVIEARLRAGAPIETGDLANLGRAFQAFIDAVEATSVTAEVVA